MGQGGKWGELEAVKVCGCMWVTKADLCKRQAIVVELTKDINSCSDRQVSKHVVLCIPQHIRVQSCRLLVCMLTPESADSNNIYACCREFFFSSAVAVGNFTTIESGL